MGFITLRLRQKYFLNGPLWNKPCLKERGTRGARLPQVISCQEEILK